MKKRLIKGFCENIAHGKNNKGDTLLSACKCCFICAHVRGELAMEHWTESVKEYPGVIIVTSKSSEIIVYSTSYSERWEKDDRQDATKTERQSVIRVKRVGLLGLSNDKKLEKIYSLG
ncbi:hypothetical protein Trydic_g15247 [Trypoxylus dichotomus]